MVQIRKKERAKDPEALADEALEEFRQADYRAREERDVRLGRRDFLRRAGVLGAVGSGAFLLGDFFGPAQALPGAGQQGTTISDEDIDAKRIAGVRIASEFASTGSGTDADPWPGSAIQDAIDDLPSTGGKVFIPAGTWMISPPVDHGVKITKSNVHLVGAGFATKLVTDGVGFTDNSSAMIAVVGTGTIGDVEGVIIADLLVDGTNTDTCRGILVQGAAEAIIQRCKAINWKGSLSQRGRGITVVNNPSTGPPWEKVAIIDCICDSNEIGIVVHRTNYTIVGCQCSDNLKDGIYLDGIDQQGSVVGNVCINDARNGIFLAPGCERCTVTGNTISGCSSGIALNNSRRNTISNNVIEHTMGSGAIYLVASSEFNTIVGNWVFDVARMVDANGIYLFNDCTHNTIRGNVVSECNRSGIAVYANSHDNIIGGNICFNNNLDGIGTFYGIFINSGDNCILMNNQCFDDQAIKTQSYGIGIASDNCMAAYNDVRGNITGGISNTGLGTILDRNMGA